MIKSKFFRMPRAGNGSENSPFGPDILDISGIAGYSCGYNSGRHVIARVYGSPEALEELSRRRAVVELSASALSRELNARRNTQRTPVEWVKRFRITYND